MLCNISDYVTYYQLGLVKLNVAVDAEIDISITCSSTVQYNHVDHVILKPNVELNENNVCVKTELHDICCIIS